MTDLTPNHPAVEAATPDIHSISLREYTPEDCHESIADALNAALPHLTADDLPTHLVRDIQVRTIRATARAVTYEEDGIPGDHCWNPNTVAEYLDGLADNIEEEGDHD